MGDRGSDWGPAVLTGIAGLASLAALLLFRDQLPLVRATARAAGFATLYAGMALFLWAALHLKGAIAGGVRPASDHLVTTGPFRFVRHPVYLGMTIALLGACLVARSLVGLLAVLSVFLPVEIHRARLEEKALARRFGDAWRRYAAATGFFFPRFGSGFRADSDR